VSQSHDRTAGQPLAESVVATHVLALTQEVLKTMFLTKMKLGTAAVLCAGLFVALIGGSFMSLGIAQDAKRAPIDPFLELTQKKEHEGKKADKKSTDQPDQMRLQGDWKVVAETFGGANKPAEERRTLVLSFAGDKVEYQTSAFSLEGTFKLAPTEQSLDITLDGRIMRALYRLEDGKLLLAVGNPSFDNERPKDLTSEKDDLSKSVLTLEPVPASKAPAKEDKAGKEAAMKKARLQCGGNLHRLVLAMHKYVDDKKRFPPAATTDLAGKPLLSWRVALLPYLGEKELFDKFRQDEPWDSKHNLKLLPKMPKIFANVSNPPKTAHATFYQVFVGEGCLFEMAKEITVGDVKDGTVNTLAIIAAAEAVPWTKPADLTYDAGKPLPSLAGGMFDDALLSFATADGSVYLTPNTIDENLLRALITRSGGEVVDLGSLRKPPE